MYSQLGAANDPMSKLIPIIKAVVNIVTAATIHPKPGTAATLPAVALPVARKSMIPVDVTIFACINPRYTVNIKGTTVVTISKISEAILKGSCAPHGCEVSEENASYRVYTSRTHPAAPRTPPHPRILEKPYFN
jgi:hypothetical protein